MSAVSELLKNPGLTQKQISGTPASIMSKEFVDPLKQNVASPLSSFLASQVGAGIPKYNAPVAASFSSQQESNISKFLVEDAGTNFTKNIEDPALRNFRDILLPDIREGYAGALSSSGRTSGESMAAVTLSADLAKQRAQYGLDFTKAQTDVAVALQNAQTMPLQAAYKTWLDEQTQGNEQLKSALTFLLNTTSTGTDIATALDPGVEGLYGEIFGAKLTEAAKNDALTSSTASALESQPYITTGLTGQTVTWNNPLTGKKGPTKESVR